LFDLCQLPEVLPISEGTPFADCLALLRKSYRFDESSGIGHLAKAANAGDYLAWRNTLADDRADIQAMPLTEDSYLTFIKQAAADYQSYFNLIQDSGMNDDQARELHKQFSCYQVLCALKDGPLGVSGLNEAIEKRMVSGKDLQTWYAGRPVIILENDYGLNLYNGDIGIVLPHSSDGREVTLKVTFVGSDGQIRWLQPSRLPKHETVYAMTIHKSQGSEFDHCALVLPDHSAPILSKELIYTGVTRAKQRLTLLYQETMVKQALSQKVQRASGLGYRLWKQSIDVGTEPSATESNHEQHADETNGSSSGEQFSLFQ